MFEAVGGNLSVDEVYVFGDGRLGACIYSNPVAQDFELFRWTSDADRLAFEPLRNVWVGRVDVTPEERPASPASAVRFTLAVDRDPWLRDAWVLRMDPSRGVGERYARSLLSERQRQDLHRYLGLDLGTEFATPLRQIYPS
jgi:hypothetical protein